MEKQSLASDLSENQNVPISSVLGADMNASKSLTIGKNNSFFLKEKDEHSSTEKRDVVTDLSRPEQNLPIIIGNINASNLVLSAIQNNNGKPMTLPIKLYEELNNPNYQVVLLQPSQTKKISIKTSSQNHTDDNIFKPALTSSDTLLLHKNEATSSEWVEMSSNPESNVIEVILNRDRSVLTQDKPFQLISDVSEKSLPLESIPSVSIFNPSDNPVITNSDLNLKRVDISQSVTSDVPSTSRVAIVGGANIPASLLLLLKKTKPDCHQSSSTTLINEENDYNSVKIESTVTNDSSSDTDTEIGEKDNSENNLNRGDTLIIPSSSNSQSLFKTTPDLDISERECINLANGEKESPPPPSSNLKNMSANDIFLDLRDGHTPMIKCLSGNLLDISGLLQTDQINSFTQSNNIICLNESLSKQTTAKETQTDIALGTSNTSIHQTELILTIDESDINQISQLETRIPPVVAVAENNLQSGNQELLSSSSGNLSDDRNLQQSSYSVVVSDQQDQQSSKLKPEQQSYPCENCDKTFKSKRALKNHSKDHNKTFKCDLCSATFTRMGNYTRHKKIHNLEAGSHKVYNCEECGRQFLQRCDLRRHLLIHSKQEPYRCEKCGKGYIRRSDLVVHMRFHLKIRPFKCSICDKSYFQSGDLNRHERKAHNPVSQLTCNHCDRKYACEATLIRHMKVSHKDIILKTVQQKLSDSRM